MSYPEYERICAHMLAFTRSTCSMVHICGSTSIGLVVSQCSHMHPSRLTPIRFPFLCTSRLFSCTDAWNIIICGLVDVVVRNIDDSDRLDFCDERVRLKNLAVFDGGSCICCRSLFRCSVCWMFFLFYGLSLFANICEPNVGRSESYNRDRCLFTAHYAAVWAVWYPERLRNYWPNVGDKVRHSCKHPMFQRIRCNHVHHHRHHQHRHPQW